MAELDTNDFFLEDGFTENYDENKSYKFDTNNINLNIAKYRKYFPHINPKTDVLEELGKEIINLLQNFDYLNDIEITDYFINVRDYQVEIIGAALFRLVYLGKIKLSNGKDFSYEIGSKSKFRMKFKF